MKTIGLSKDLDKITVKTCPTPTKTCPSPNKTCPNPNKTFPNPNKTCPNPNKILFVLAHLFQVLIYFELYRGLDLDSTSSNAKVESQLLMIISYLIYLIIVFFFF